MEWGVVNLIDKKEEIDEYSEKTDKEILKQFSNIGLNRVEFQIYLAIFDLYLANCKQDNERPVLISIKDFHTKVLENKNRLRKSNIDKYNMIFRRLTNKYIKINTSSANIAPYKIKSIKSLRLESIITNIAIIKLPNYKEEIVKIFPTEYMLLEFKQLSHISNYFPRNFITLDMREHDNILFFGYYLVKMHKINIKNQKDFCFRWEIKLSKLISEALQNVIKFINKYSNERRKKECAEREIINPLKKACTIMKNSGYIVDFGIDNLNVRNIMADITKLVINFNYNKGKIKNSN
jgi:hypothetical protein